MAEQKSLAQIDQEIEAKADRIEKAFETREKVKAQEEDAYDGFSDTNVKLIPNPNFTDCQPLGTLLPINMANETVGNLSRFASEFNLTDFIKDKLGYSSKLAVAKSFSSEQVDALVLAIKCFEKNNAFILGDMAGIGKGRVCAGVMRYAYMNGFIPVFITQKPYLFNDIYRDLMDIDGIGSSSKQSMILPKPLILHNEGVIIEPKGFSPVPTAQEYRESEKGNQRNYYYVDRTKEFSINEICKRISNNIENGGQIKLTKEFNCVMLPYSVISQGREQIRRNFLLNISQNALFIFDECHNAASANVNANILKYSLPLVQNSKGVLFSSATYAKNPNVFNLYVVKTSLSTAVPSLESISDALKVGGENVSEYIASGLVKEGEMIRRERSFSNCAKVTEYVGTRRSVNEDGETIYTDLPNDRQREFFDEAIGYFKLLRDFTRKPKSFDAIKNAVLRKAASLRLELAAYEDYKGLKSYDERSFWIERNRNKYVPFYKPDSITRYKATFRENVFLALKAKFSADRIIECLNTPVQYTNVDGSTNYAPMKPLIAIANTGEAIFNELQLKPGDMIKNDISEYLRAIYRKLFVGDVTYRKVDANFFMTKAELLADGSEFEEVEAEYEVLMEDFVDNGEEIQQIQNTLNAYVSNIPFSIIDYLRDAIESTPRADIYFQDPQRTIPRFGKSNSTNYTFQEGTSREYMLVRRGEMWEYVRNNRIRSISGLFRGFNDGIFDVMLINVVASTGGSAHSSPKEGMDTRPRNMFIVQFELDINVEVQKRGRVNRTGQLNFPTYTYVITKVPVELRKYLMLRKKLRKLDANTSADQTASSKTAEITDSKNRTIEDIFNAYGYDVFIRSFLTDPNNGIYETIFNNLNFRQSKNVTGDAEKDNINVEHFNAFVRELELYSTEFQEKFFDEMNSLYIAKKEELIRNNEYQEELRPLNYKASLKQRIVRQLNSGTTIFSLPLFLSDYYTLNIRKPFSLDRVNQKMNDLAVWEGRQVQPDEFWRNLITDFRTNQQLFLDSFREQFTTLNQPKREDFSNNEDYDEQLNIFNARLTLAVSDKRSEQNQLLDKILYFKPNTPVNYNGNLGKFIGYRIIQRSSNFKYTPGTVEFFFCFLTEYPLLVLRMSSNQEELGGIAKIYDTNTEKIDKINLWQPNLYQRSVKRFYSGNILSGIVQAQEDKTKSQKEIEDGSLPVKNFVLSRFTNIDGSITTAVELKFDREYRLRTLNENIQTLAIDANSEFFLEYARELPYSTTTNVNPIWNIENEKLCDRAICVKKVTINNVEFLEFEIIQSAKSSKVKGTNRTFFKERKPEEEMYNFLYYNDTLLNNYRNYLSVLDTNYQEITYAFKTWRQRDVKKDQVVDRTEHNKLYVHKKVLSFQLNNSQSIDAMSRFLNEIQNEYSASFSFRSQGINYLNIEDTEDVSREAFATEEEVRSTYPTGEYEYKFLRDISESIFTQIPNVVKRTNAGFYGGVILSQPIEPNKLPSFELKPFKIPNKVLIQLAISVLDAQQKEDFIRQVNEKALSETDIQIGEFVRQYLTKRSVPTIYFFGDLRGSEYGKLFKDNALNLEIEEIAFETSEEARESGKKKKIVEMNDAEDYLLTLLQLL